MSVSNRYIDPIILIFAVDFRIQKNQWKSERFVTPEIER